MSVYIISYDLMKEGKNEEQSYPELIAAIKAYEDWAKIGFSAWAIVSNDTAIGICNNLKRHIDSNDKIFISELTHKNSAWCRLDDRVSQWLKNNLG